MTEVFTLNPFTVFYATATLPTGGLVSVGSSFLTQSVVIAQSDINGHSDESFGIGGIVTTNFEHLEGARVAVSPNGKIIVAGRAISKSLLANYLPDGSPNIEFGVDGQVTLLASSVFGGGVRDLAVQTDGKLLLSGTQGSGFLGYPGKPGVARFYDDLALDQSVVAIEDQPISITLVTLGNVASYQVVDQPTHGSLSGPGPTVTYTPDPDFFGTDSFTFFANDGIIDSNIATVTITVNPVNDAPTANPQTVPTNEDSPVSVVLSGFDVEDDPLDFFVIAGPSHGTLSGSGADRTYTPDPTSSAATALPTLQTMAPMIPRLQP